MYQKSRTVLVCLLALLAAGCGLNHEFAGAAFTEPVTVPEIPLQSVDGPVRLQDFAGQYTFVYFGYTFCPDVCPATLGRLREVREALGADAEQVAVVMITVDPARDTPAKLAEYMGYFDPTFVGLSGDPADIDTVGIPFGLFYEAHEGASEANYLVDHTAWFYLLDRESQLIVAYPQETSVDELVGDLKYLMKND